MTSTAERDDPPARALYMEYRPTMSGDARSQIRWDNLVWVVAAVAIMTVAIVMDDLWLLDFVHVFSSSVWSGVDLFMGFALGPILRRLDLPVRQQVLGRLMPRTIFLMPTLAVISTTSGWYLARLEGFTDLDYPEVWWMVAALSLAAVLTIQAVAVLLPVNVRICLEMQSPSPDNATIARLLRLYIAVVASQGVLQVATVLVMARFATGL
jgi:hypothetical protein